MTYQGATDMIGRMQAMFMQLGFAPGTRVAFLTANRADTWCAGVAAQLSRLPITWLHPLGSLDDQLFQLEDSEAQMLVVDGVTFRDRGGELAARATGLKTVFTLGRPITARSAAGDRGRRQRHRAAASPGLTISPR
jgi:fatty-acyl-CoA synthase